MFKVNSNQSECNEMLQIIKTLEIIQSNNINHSTIFSLPEFRSLLEELNIPKKDIRICYELFRISHGKYGFKMLDYWMEHSSEIEQSLSLKKSTIETVQSESPINSENIVQMITPSSTFDPKMFIPQKRSEFVPFGFSSALKTIIQSEMFFPVYITGPSGTGKNIGIEQVCAKLNKPMLHYSITEETSEEDLIGCWTLVNGNTVWKEGPVVLAARHGMMMVLDEIDLATPKIMCLQSILNGDPIIIHSKNEKLIPKKGFTIVATGNTKGFGESDIYVGTQALNEAFLERFKVMFEHSFPTENILNKMIQKKMELLNITKEEDVDFGNKLAKFVSHICSAYSSGATQYYISNRRVSFIIETYAIFKDKLKSISYVFGRFPKEVAESFLSLYTKIDENISLDIESVLNQFNNINNNVDANFNEDF